MALGNLSASQFKFWGNKPQAPAAAPASPSSMSWADSASLVSYAPDTVERVADAHRETLKPYQPGS